MRVNRRTYLKAGLVSSLAFGGVVGIATSADGSTNQSSSRGQPAASGSTCPAGTTLVVKFEWDGSAFDVEKGDASAVTIENVVTDEDGEPVAFDWTATVPIACVTVKHGRTTTPFEGGFEGSVDLSGERNAISNVSFCGPRGGRAVLCEIDMDGPGADAFDVETHVESGPCSGLGSRAVHVVSTRPTKDYAHAMVNVLDRLGRGVTLDDLTGLTFDYAELEDNEGAAPDEVFVSMLTPGDQLKLAVTHVNDGRAGDAAESCTARTWNALDDVTGGEWSIADITVDDLRTSPAATSTAAALRDSGRVGSLTPSFADATLVGVGVGAGNTRSATTIDRFFANLQVNWTGGSATFDFPAVVPTSLSFDPGTIDSRGNGTLTASLSFQRSEGGLGLDDVDDSSVTLNEFRNVVPPVERGVQPRGVQVQGNELVVSFQAGRVAEFLGTGSHSPIVSGDFATASGSSFYGVGELTVE